MDGDQENMQSLGLLGIYKESCKLIFSYWKIFTKITLPLILPLSFIYLAHLKVYDLLNKKIWLSLEVLDCTEVSTSHNHKPSDLVSSEWTYFILLDTIFLTFVYILSLLSSVTVVCTIACIYTARDVTFMKAMNVIPMVWKRLMITSLYLFGTIVAYSTVAGLVVLVIVSIASFLGATSVICLLIILVSLILYLVGLIYLSTIWNLANVVSILEESYGAQAMVKSRTLMRGKILITMVIYFTFTLLCSFIQLAFQTLVLHGHWRSVSKVLHAILCLLLFSTLNLFSLVIQTVIYFVCKSYYREDIDKALSNHLKAYLSGKHVPLKSKDVQLEESLV
ncbi:hypothetical protein SLE2022_330370 [Rubroshorea leprosula]